MSLRKRLPLAVICGALLAAACTLPAPSLPPAEPSPTTGVGEPGPPAGGSGAIGGRVWNDLCEPAPDVAVPAGCIAGPDGSLRANGILEQGETGIGGVLITLGAGACPASDLTSVASAGDGTYVFPGLGAGTYCVSIDAAAQPVLSGLQGVWTFPTVSEPSGVAAHSVQIGDGEVRGDVNFGWDFATQPTPTPEPATPTPELETATPTLTPTATPSSGDPRARLANPTWRDPFDNGANWPLYTDEHVRFVVQDGTLEMRALRADLWDGWMLTWPEVGNLYLEITATQQTCEGLDRFGVVFRSTSTARGYVGYLYGLSCDGRVSLRIWDGERFTQLIPWTTTPHARVGSDQSNRLGVWADGSRIELYLNGELVGEFTDTTYAGGKYGVYIGAARTVDFSVRVDEIAYWALP